jgi:hypothetical protein
MNIRLLRRALLIASPVAMLACVDIAAAQPFMLNNVCQQWPNGPLPRPKFSTVDRSDPAFTKLQTGLFVESIPGNVHPTEVPGVDLATEGGALYPEGDSFGSAPTNLLPTVYGNARDCMGEEIINTLPSTPDHPYNLHVDDPLTTPPVAIDKTSPTDDLDVLRRYLTAQTAKNKPLDAAKLQMGIDILEGNPVAGRVYSGLPLLHYNGPLKTKTVDPATRTVKIHQIWFDTHIEADTSYIDPTPVEKLPDGSWDDGEWYIEYTIDVLNRGHEDFAPYAMFFDDPADIPGGARVPNVAMDQTFFPMEEGLRYTFKMKMPPARFYNLTYHWGWRLHPPRVQVAENVNVGFTMPDGTVVPRNHFEKVVFGENPRASEEAKLAAIGAIGDLAPAKRMWNALRALKSGAYSGKSEAAAHAAEFDDAFFDWSNRNELPSGIDADPDADVTLVYMNNTIYGHIKGYVRDAQMEMDKWKKRGDKVHVQLLNADYYPHTYILVDFGGMRGWENTFQNTIPFGGAGPWFTFGRHGWWVHTVGFAGGPILVPAAMPAGEIGAAEIEGETHGKGEHREKGERRELAGESSKGKGEDRDYSMFVRKEGQELKAAKGSAEWLIAPADVANEHDLAGLGRHDIEVTFTYEPSRRLRMYQFDAWHHDIAVWSMH